MFRLSCVHFQTFVWPCLKLHAFTRHSCLYVPDFRAFTTLSCAHVKTFLRSCPKVRELARNPCLHVQIFLPSCPDIRAFMVIPSWVYDQTFVCSCPSFTRYSCVRVQTLVRSPHFRALMFRLAWVRSRLSCLPFQTFVHSFSDLRMSISKTSCVHNTFVRSCSDFLSVMARFSWVCQKSMPLVPSCIQFQTFVPSCADIRAFIVIPSCVLVLKLMRSPDFVAFVFRLSYVHI